MATRDVEVLSDDASIEDAFAVRRAVFVEEQSVSEDVEYDGRDGDAIHLIAREDDRPVGTTRLRTVGSDTLKVERVAVLPDYRDRGWGRRLMEAAEAEAGERGLSHLVLHAQKAVEGFYHALDYETTSDAFEEAGIVHVEMEKSVDQ